MSRQTYVFDPNQGKLVPGRSPPRTGSYSNIVADLPDFVSPIDGSVVNGRRGMREQFARHNVTHASDFTNTWKKAESERTDIRAGNFDRKARHEAIRAAYNK